MLIFIEKYQFLSSPLFFPLYQQIEDNKYNKRSRMHKGSLVEILFESTESAAKVKKLSLPECTDKEVICRQYENVFHKSQTGNRTSKIIKITQFNSSLVIGDEKMHKINPTNFSASPQKNFTIKKISELKSKVAASAQQIIEIQMKKREKMVHIQLNQSFANDNKPIDKILVTTRCNIKNQAPKIEALTASIVMDAESCNDQISIEDSFIGFFKQKRKEIKQHKDTSNLKEKGSNVYARKNDSGNKLEVLDFSGKIEDFTSLPRRSSVSPRKNYSRHIQQQKKYQEMIEKEKRDLLELKKEVNKNYAKPFNPPENITANAYIIYESDAKRSKFLKKISLIREEGSQTQETRKTLLNSHKVMAAFNSRSCVQIASLTKIMTCILALDLAKRWNLKLKEEIVVIGIFQQNIGGTSANLQKGEIYSVEQLLYGLMLPSGNDASLAIAVWGGKLLLQKDIERKDQLASTACSSVQNAFKKKDCYQRFIVQMNSKAVELNMDKTKYANSHGLSNFQNKSCTYDLALLCQYAMNNKQFRDIVSTKIYETVINIESDDTFQKQTDANDRYQHTKIQKASSQNEMQQEQMKDYEQINEDYNDEVADSKSKKGDKTKLITWENTHQLLQQKSNIYTGIKTGITNTAGPCLASSVQINGKRFIIIVLNCKSMKYRFKDTQNLRKWLFSKEEIKQKEQPKGDAMNETAQNFREQI